MTIVLVTHFADSASYADVEKNFRRIMQRVAPGGLEMLNWVQRKEFIVATVNYRGRVLWKGGRSLRGVPL
jgi:BMFP domain-containing protein YqiC